MSTAAAAPWLRSRGYDLGWFFGGALASIAIPLLLWWRPTWTAAVFWIWLISCDGSHLWATYSRTYLDAGCWRAQRRLLLASLLVWLAPAAAAALWWTSGSRGWIDAFLLVAQAWAFHHVVRQHYGFVSLYDRRAGSTAAAHARNRRALHVGMWSAYLLFLLTHPVNRAIAGLPPWDASRPLDLVVALALTLLVAGALAAAAASWSAAQRGGSTPAAAFAALCIATYALVFTAVAAREPHLAGARTTVEHFLVVGMAMSVFHNVQYHGIVRLYHARAYAGGPSLAARANASWPRYALAALAFAACYGAVAWATNDYPAPGGAVPEPIFAPLAFCALWGLLLHHYLLDQFIWRPSRQPALRQALVGA